MVLLHKEFYQHLITLSFLFHWQWTSFLDLVERALKQNGYGVVRIDGSMTTEQRSKSMHKLAHDNSVKIILCSLKAAGVGINLTRANNVFMLDPWWNDSSEQQAIGMWFWLILLVLLLPSKKQSCSSNCSFAFFRPCPSHGSNSTRQGLSYDHARKYRRANAWNPAS